ncbi:MAG: sulfotransferase, partial [Wenzhouxiangella sp.]
MFRLFLSSLFLSSRLWLSVLVSPLREGRSLLGALLVALGWPVFMVLQLLQWAGFALDEIFFRDWRHVEVAKPVFVLGPPRSGTTHLHHVLAQDPSTTTFRLWECLFGLSVSARRLVRLLVAADRRVGRPLARLGRFLGARLGAGMADVHPLALDAPEEDFLVLLPAMQCFILIAVFPNAGWLWRTARLDHELKADERVRLMDFYAACVKKHLYVHGADKRFLSKNASFSGSPESLLAVFPDARFFACQRDPVAT